jgi:hypothetical protein
MIILAALPVVPKFETATADSLARRAISVHVLRCFRTVHNLAEAA